MAADGTVLEDNSDGRIALGECRRLLRIRQRGQFRIGERIEQQDPRHLA